jgi:hypothetical protein
LSSKTFNIDIFQITEKNNKLKTTIFWQTIDLIIDVSLIVVVKGLRFWVCSTWNHSLKYSNIQLEKFIKAWPPLWLSYLSMMCWVRMEAEQLFEPLGHIFVTPHYISASFFLQNFWFQTFCCLEILFVYIFIIPRDFWLKSLEQPTICKAERRETFESLNLSLNLSLEPYLCCE